MWKRIIFWLKGYRRIDPPKPKPMTKQDAARLQ